MTISSNKQISKVHSTFGRNYSPATVLKKLQKKYGDIDLSSIDENSFFQQRKIGRKIITTPLPISIAQTEDLRVPLELKPKMERTGRGNTSVQVVLFMKNNNTVYLEAGTTPAMYIGYRNISLQDIHGIGQISSQSVDNTVNRSMTFWEV